MKWLTSFWLGLYLIMSFPMAGLCEEQPVDVVIVSSRANQIVHEKNEVRYRQGVKFWAAVCDQAGLSYRIAGDYELETGPGPARAYVLYLTTRLTPSQRANLEELKKKGTGLILVGQTGALDAQGKKTDSLATKWFELTDVRAYAASKSAYFVNLHDTVMALANVPGFRFEYDWAGTFVLARSPYAIAANVDWLMNPFPEPDSYQANTTIAARILDGSRMAWFGVQPDVIVADKEEQQVFIKKSVIALLRWVVREPVALPCHWEGCRNTATVVTADVEDRFHTGNSIGLACHKEGVKGSFFLVGSLAPNYPDAVMALAQSGEIGSHSITHKSFRKRSLEDQLAELTKWTAIMKKMGVNEVIGFRPPMEQYDEATIEAVGKAGLKFIYGNLDYDRSYPILRDVNGIHVYQFARIVADDYNLVVEHGVKNAAQYKAGYVKEFGRIEAMGALFPFSFHTNYLALDETVDVIRGMIRHCKESNSWITTFGSIVEWLEKRQSVLTTTSITDGIVTLVVENSGQKAVTAFPVRYFPARDNLRVDVLGTPEEGIKLTPRVSGGVVVFVDLKPGEIRTIHLR
jgi:peptidoglycan/xylan/chitin deacetylase (PgdA/CDA1 family)